MVVEAGGGAVGRAQRVVGWRACDNGCVSGPRCGEMRSVGEGKLMVLRKNSSGILVSLFAHSHLQELSCHGACGSSSS